MRLRYAVRSNSRAMCRNTSPAGPPWVATISFRSASSSVVTLVDRAIGVACDLRDARADLGATEDGGAHARDADRLGHSTGQFASVSR